MMPGQRNTPPVHSVPAGVTFRNLPNYQLKIRDLLSESNTDVVLVGTTPANDFNLPISDIALFSPSSITPSIKVYNAKKHPEFNWSLANWLNPNYPANAVAADPDFPLMYQCVNGSHVMRGVLFSFMDAGFNTLQYVLVIVYDSDWVTKWRINSGECIAWISDDPTKTYTFPTVVTLGSKAITSGMGTIYSIFQSLAANSGDWSKVPQSSQQYGSTNVSSFVKLDKISIICSFVKAASLVTGDLYNDSSATVLNKTVANSQLIIKSLNSSLINDCDLKDIELSPGNYYLKSTDSFDKVVYLQKVD